VADGVQHYNDLGNENWYTTGMVSIDTIQAAFLQVIRDEIKMQTELLHCIVSVLECHNTAAIPRILRKIENNTRKKPRKVGKMRKFDRKGDAK
jgi:predicted RNA-binding protein with RPS1 domain